MTHAQEDWNNALRATYRLAKHLPQEASRRLLNALYALPDEIQAGDPYGKWEQR